MHRLKTTYRIGSIGKLARHGKIVIIIMAILFPYIMSHGSVGAAFLGGVLSASVCGLVDPRFNIAMGLLCFTLYPILALAEQGAWLQQSPLVNYYAASIGIYSIKSVIDMMMAWAFYFLSIGLLGRLARYLVQREKSFDNV